MNAPPMSQKVTSESTSQEEQFESNSVTLKNNRGKGKEDWPEFSK